MKIPSKEEIEKIFNCKLMEYQYIFLKTYLSLPKKRKLCFARQSNFKEIIAIAQLVELILLKNGYLKEGK